MHSLASASRTIEAATDATGRVVAVARPDGKTESASYDAVGNVTHVTPADTQAHEFAYSPTNQQTQYRPPAVAGAQPEQSSFDKDELVTAQTWGDGSQTQVMREGSGRVTSVRSPWWQTDFGYTSTTGQVASAVRGGERLEWQYDGFLRLAEAARGVVTADVRWGTTTRTFG